MKNFQLTKHKRIKDNVRSLKIRNLKWKVLKVKKNFQENLLKKKKVKLHKKEKNLYTLHNTTLKISFCRLFLALPIPRSLFHSILVWIWRTNKFCAFMMKNKKWRKKKIPLLSVKSSCAKAFKALYNFFKEHRKDNQNQRNFFFLFLKIKNIYI